MTVSVKLNLSRLRRALSGEQQAIDRGARNAALAIEDLAQQLAPVDTGALRESIHIEQDRAGSYKIVASVPYAQHVEYGTHRAPAQPFLTPALHRVNPLTFIAAEIKALLR